MTNRVDRDSELVQQILTSVDLHARQIQANAGYVTPDLELPVDGRRMLIEVKRKADDEQLKTLLAAQAGQTLNYSNQRTRDRIEHGWRQVRDFPYRDTLDYTVVWLVVADGPPSALAGPGARAELYGLEQLEGLTDNGNSYCRRCYFFYNSAFFRNKDLDAVIIHGAHSLEVCLNPFSHRFEDLRRSKFITAVRPFMEVIDPILEEGIGDAFFADCDFDRRDVNAVVAFVCKKYALGKPTIWRYRLVNMPAGEDGVQHV